VDYHQRNSEHGQHWQASEARENAQDQQDRANHFRKHRHRECQGCPQTERILDPLQLAAPVKKLRQTVDLKKQQSGRYA